MSVIARYRTESLRIFYYFAVHTFLLVLDKSFESIVENCDILENTTWTVLFQFPTVQYFYLVLSLVLEQLLANLKFSFFQNFNKIHLRFMTFKHIYMYLLRIFLLYDQFDQHGW